jgi:hypothetical protein
MSGKSRKRSRRHLKDSVVLIEESNSGEFLLAFGAVLGDMILRSQFQSNTSQEDE